MVRRQFSREFKLEAVRLVKERGVSVVQASRDLDVGENILRRWIKELTADPGQARAECAARPYLPAHMGAHRLLRRLPVGSRRSHRGLPPAPQAGTGQEDRMASVPGPFTRGVVCTTTCTLFSNGQWGAPCVVNHK